MPVSVPGLLLSTQQQVQVPAGQTPAEFVIQRRFFFVVPISTGRSDVSPHLMRGRRGDGLSHRYRSTEQWLKAP